MGEQWRGERRAGWSNGEALGEVRKGEVVPRIPIRGEVMGTRRRSKVEVRRREQRRRNGEVKGYQGGGWANSGGSKGEDMTKWYEVMEKQWGRDGEAGGEEGKYVRNGEAVVRAIDKDGGEVECTGRSGLCSGDLKPPASMRPAICWSSRDPH